MSGEVEAWARSDTRGWNATAAPATPVSARRTCDAGERADNNNDDAPPCGEERVRPVKRPTPSSFYRLFSWILSEVPPGGKEGRGGCGTVWEGGRGGVGGNKKPGLATF